MQNLVNRAIEFAEQKNEKGLLVWDEIPEFNNEQDAKDWWLTPEGDRETLYSIATLFANETPEGFSINECRDILEDALCEKFPNKCD